MSLNPIEIILDILGKKWSVLVIKQIGDYKKIRYNNLQLKLEGISPSMLTSTLRQLENTGIIERKVFNEIPPKVEYSLSKKGKEFQKLLEPLVEWAISQEDTLCKSKSEKDLNPIQKIKERGLKKLIEASMCACTCMAMMAAYTIFAPGIF